jgi:hypothetical protein
MTRSARSASGSPRVADGQAALVQGAGGGSLAHAEMLPAGRRRTNLDKILSM